MEVLQTEAAKAVGPEKSVGLMEQIRNMADKRLKVASLVLAMAGAATGVEALNNALAKSQVEEVTSGEITQFVLKHPELLGYNKN
jgi:hypothetical protein